MRPSGDGFANLPHCQLDAPPSGNVGADGSPSVEDREGRLGGIDRVTTGGDESSGVSTALVPLAILAVGRGAITVVLGAFHLHGGWTSVGSRVGMGGIGHCVVEYLLECRKRRE